jgi:Putative addiction module component
MLKTIEGIYQDGQIRFTELPQDIVDQSQVLVTFLTPGSIDSVKLRQLIDQLETIEGIQKGFEELNSGQTRPIDDFMKEFDTDSVIQTVWVAEAKIRRDEVRDGSVQTIPGEEALAQVRRLLEP